jgi:hypothetical protein
LSGFKYVDANNNGTKDPGEPPIQGVKITLTGQNDLGNSITLVAFTDANGFYSFDTAQFPELRPSATGYTLTETPPINFIIGKPAVGTFNGITVGTIMSNTVITNIVVDAKIGLHGINYDFGELGLTPPFVSKRSLLFPAQPVVLTAVYETPVTTAAKVQTATVKAPAPKKVTLAVKKPAPKKVVTPVKKVAAKVVAKIPIVITAKKKK